MPIPLTLYKCLGRGLKLCIFSAYNLQIIFTVKVDGFKVFCVENSSFSFMPIPLKCYRYLGHGLKMCISFGNNPQIIFVTFYRHFLGIITFKVNSSLEPCACNSSYNFMPILLKIKETLCGGGHKFPEFVCF